MMFDEADRTLLPAKSNRKNKDGSGGGIWAVLKNCVGKELSKVTMPIQLNEPLSFLQRIAEHLEYSELIDKAVSEVNDPLKRIEYVGAFAVSALASNQKRLGKPFNPIIGETYQLQRKNYRLLCEQVSHHPPVSAFHAESQDFVFEGWIHPKLKFWGKSVEIHPKGEICLTLKSNNEQYTWRNIGCTVHGILIGRLWIEHHGTMEIQCRQTGLSLPLHFKHGGASKSGSGGGWFKLAANHQPLPANWVDGFVVDTRKQQPQRLRYVYGTWTHSIRSTDVASYDEFSKRGEKLLKVGPTGDHHNSQSTCASSDHNISSSSSVSGKKSPLVSPSVPGRKILQKFNSMAIGSGRSLAHASTASIDQQSMSFDADGPTNCSSSEDDENEEHSDEVMDLPNSRLLWEVKPRPENSHEYYNFTSFTYILNQLPADESRREMLCPTDSRLRPDIRLLEEGEMERAGEIKCALEEKQRRFLKQYENQYQPAWFNCNQSDGSAAGKQLCRQWEYNNEFNWLSWAGEDEDDAGSSVGVGNVAGSGGTSNTTKNSLHIANMFKYPN